MNDLYDIRRGGIFQWAWVPLVLLLVWWWYRRRPAEEALVEREIEIVLPPVAEERPAAKKRAQAAPARAGRKAARPAARKAPAAGKSSGGDDLKKIEGIGPKISGVLREAGIGTFAQLGATDANRLERILRDAGIRIASPETWPEQARLAAAGDWKGLKALQSRLSRGRRLSSPRSKAGARSN